MTLEEFKEEILGEDECKYTKEQVLHFYELSNNLFEISFHNFLQERNQNNRLKINISDII